jgi:hypothetical protein
MTISHRTRRVLAIEVNLPNTTTSSGIHATFGTRRGSFPAEQLAGLPEPVKRGADSGRFRHTSSPLPPDRRPIAAVRVTIGTAQTADLAWLVAVDDLALAANELVAAGALHVLPGQCQEPPLGCLGRVPPLRLAHRRLVATFLLSTLEAHSFSVLTWGRLERSTLGGQEPHELAPFPAWAVSYFRPVSVPFRRPLILRGVAGGGLIFRSSTSAPPAGSWLPGPCYEVPDASCPPRLRGLRPLSVRPPPGAGRTGRRTLERAWTPTSAPPRPGRAGSSRSGLQSSGSWGLCHGGREVPPARGLSSKFDRGHSILLSQPRGTRPGVGRSWGVRTGERLRSAHGDGGRGIRDS